MSFVYRYRDPAGRARYYGMVKGDSASDLFRRITEHSYEPDFSPDWEVHYIEGLSRADADFLETYFINADGEYLINKAKRGRGPMHLDPETIPEWQPYEPLLRRLTENKKAAMAQRVSSLRVPSYTICRHCGCKVPTSNYFSVDIAVKLRHVPATGRDGEGEWIYGKDCCRDCAEVFYDSFNELLDDFFRRPETPTPSPRAVSREQGAELLTFLADLMNGYIESKRRKEEKNEPVL